MLADAQRLTGDYSAWAANLAEALDLYRGLRHRLGEAETMGILGRRQTVTGDCPAVGTNLRQELTIYQRIGAPAAKRIQETPDYHRPTFLPAEPNQRPPAKAIRRADKTIQGQVLSWERRRIA